MRVLPLLLVAAAASACGPVADEPQAPRGIYLPVEVSRPAGAQRSLSSALPIYLNRSGGTYHGGNDDSATNTSSVVPYSSTSLSAFDGSDALWDDVVACVADQFSRFGAYVTDVEPTSGDYIEAVIAGYPEDVGLPSGVGGVAPMDPYYCDIIPNAVVYVFALALPLDAQMLCEIAAQEVAHALSLDHELLCEDPMTYLSGCGDKSFQDTAAACGEYSARECACGRPSQNSVQVLYEKLGASDGTAPPPPVDDDVSPAVTLLSPANGSTLAGNTVIQVTADVSDNSGLAAVDLDWYHTGDLLPCPASTQSFTCSRSGDRHTWQINVGTGSRTFRVRAYDLAGNVSTSATRTIHLDGDASPGDVQEGDVYSGATPIPCSTGVDRVATPGTVDWLVAAVAADVEVTATLTSLGGAKLSMTVSGAGGPDDVLDSLSTTSTLATSVVAESSQIGLGITSLDVTGAYRVVLTCDQPRDGARDRWNDDDDDQDAPPAAGQPSWCAQSGASPFGLVLLFGLALLGRRSGRRRIHRGARGHGANVHC